MQVRRRGGGTACRRCRWQTRDLRALGGALVHEDAIMQAAMPFQGRQVLAEQGKPAGGRPVARASRRRSATDRPMVVSMS